MSERDITHTWEIETVASVLQADQSPQTDHLLGAGVRLAFGRSDKHSPALLDLYPERLAARFQRGVAQLELGSVQRFEAYKAGWLIQSADAEARASLYLEASGKAVFSLRPLEEAQAPGMTDTSNAVRELSTSQLQPSPAEPEAAAQDNQEQEGRFVFTGRVGKAVRPSVTPKGTHITAFDLAVHSGEKTDWKKIKFFNDRAKQAAEQLAKGDLVTVICYRDVREYQGRDGKIRQVEEFRGTAFSKG